MLRPASIDVDGVPAALNGGDYARIEAALRYLDAHAAQQPSLADVAKHVHLSEFHFQRLFRRWAGITPKRYLQVRTLAHAKQSLAAEKPLLDAAWEAGLSGPGRLHDLFVTLEAVTPGEYKTRGAGLAIEFGFHPTPFGLGLIGVTPRGICHLAFLDTGREAAALKDLRRAWPAAKLQESPTNSKEYMARIFGPRSMQNAEPLHVLHAGTNFQARVWNALLRIPPGTTASYAELARSIGHPRAARAVGQACARNSIAFLIPCHRVIRELGGLGSYRWGVPRKRILLAHEQARAHCLTSV